MWRADPLAGAFIARDRAALVSRARDVNREYILGVLQSVGGGNAGAASELDIVTVTLFGKLKQLGLGLVGSRE